MNRDTRSPLRLSLFGEKVENIDLEAEGRRQWDSMHGRSSGAG